MIDKAVDIGDVFVVLSCQGVGEVDVRECTAKLIDDVGDVCVLFGGKLGF